MTPFEIVAERLAEHRAVGSHVTRLLVSHAFGIQLVDAALAATPVLPPRLVMTEAELDAYKAGLEEGRAAIRERLVALVKANGYVGSCFGIPVYSSPQAEDLLLEERT